MRGYRKRNEGKIIVVEEAVVEKRLSQGQIKKLDKIYIIAACVLILSWGIWNLEVFQRIKLPSLSFIGDYFAERASDRNGEVLSTGDTSVKVIDDYIIYINYYTNELYSMKKDGTENRMILDSPYYRGFDVKDGWVYYTSWKDEGIMKMKPDGSEKTEVIKPDLGVYLSFTIVGNKIYYYNDDTNLYRANIDGTGSERIVNLKSSVKAFFPYGNWIYYTDYVSGNIYRNRMDSKSVYSEGELIIESSPERFVTQLCAYKGMLYYLNEKQELIRCKLDGTQPSVIDTDVIYFTIEGKNLYYSKYGPPFTGNDSGMQEMILIKTDPKGNEKEKVFSERATIYYAENGIGTLVNTQSLDMSFIDLNNNTRINIPEPQYVFLTDIYDRIKNKKPGVRIPGIYNMNYIVKTEDNSYYFIDVMGNGEFSKYDKNSNTTVNISTQDTGGTKINNIKGYTSFDVLGDVIIYISSDDGCLYAANSDGSKCEKILDVPINIFEIRDDKIYFLSRYSKLYRGDFKTGNIEKITDSRIGAYRIVDDYIYYYTIEKPEVLVKLSQDGKSREEFTISHTYSNFNIIDDYIYGQEYSFDKTKLLRQKLGSTESETILDNFFGEFNVIGEYIVNTDYSKHVNGYPPIYLTGIDGTQLGVIDSVSEHMRCYFDERNIYIMKSSSNFEEIPLKSFIKTRSK